MGGSKVGFGKDVLFYGGGRCIVWDLEGFVGVDVIGVPWLRGVKVGRGDGAKRADVEGVCWEEEQPGWHSSCWCALGVFLNVVGAQWVQWSWVMHAGNNLGC